MYKNSKISEKVGQTVENYKKIKKEVIAAMTGREEDIMNILWSSDNPLTAKEIVEKSNGLKMNTVQACLRNLLKNGIIDVKDVVYSNTVLARSYVPAITAEDFAVTKLTAEYNRLRDKVSKVAFVGMLLNEEDKDTQKREVDELKKLLDMYKE